MSMNKDENQTIHHQEHSLGKWFQVASQMVEEGEERREGGKDSEEERGGREEIGLKNFILTERQKDKLVTGEENHDVRKHHNNHNTSPG